MKRRRKRPGLPSTVRRIPITTTLHNTALHNTTLHNTTLDIRAAHSPQSFPFINIQTLVITSDSTS